MPRIREGHGATIQVPPPVPLDRVRRSWDDVPELACVDAWQRACRAWWADPEDRRLRAAALQPLWLDEAEMAAWHARPFDRDALIRAHGHVTAMRAGVETDLSKRALVTGELRTVPVWTDHRDGTRRLFAAAEDVPRMLGRAYVEYAQLPQHPFIRAAWLSQMLGVVHPFRDANGGTARFLASLELMRSAFPAFVLPLELRNGAYIESVALRDTLDPLSVVVYDATQQEIARTLLAERVRAGTWDASTQARAERWTQIAAAMVREAMGTEVQESRSIEAAGARLARGSVRLPLSPAPSVTTWTVATPVPLYVDVAITVVQGGPTRWLRAVIAGRAGKGGELGAGLDRQYVPLYFIAPDEESDANVDARLRRWLATRIDQTVRGLARWM